MAGTTVYGIPGSPSVCAVEVTVDEKGVPYHLHQMAPGEHKSEEYLKRHPFGHMSAFEHEDLAIYETQAIARYLGDRFPHPLLTPSTPERRTITNRVIAIIEWYFLPKAAAPIGFNRIIGTHCLASREMKPPSPMPCQWPARAKFDRLLGDRGYFTGDSMTIADIMLATQLELLGECREGRDLIKGGDHLQSWAGRASSRQARRRSCAWSLKFATPPFSLNLTKPRQHCRSVRSKGGNMCL